MFLYLCLQNPKLCPDAVKFSVKVAEILVKNGCDPLEQNEVGITPVSAAIMEVRLFLVSLCDLRRSGISHN